MTMLVGEAPARGADNVTWTGRSADRLTTLLGQPVRQTFRCVNLFHNLPSTGHDRPGWARQRARELQHAYNDDYTWLLAGRRVAAAFGLCHDWSFFKPMYGAGEDDVARLFYVIPHPSGLSRWWNDPKNTRAAQQFLRRIASRS